MKNKKKLDLIQGGIINLDQILVLVARQIDHLKLKVNGAKYVLTTNKDVAIPHNCLEYETALDDIITLITNKSDINKDTL